MVAVLEGDARKQKAAKALLAIGGAALLFQLWALWLEAGQAWSHAAAESLGWLGALGVAVLQMVDYLAWNPNAVMLSVAKVLLLFWPVAVMAAGVALARKAD